MRRPLPAIRAVGEPGSKWLGRLAVVMQIVSVILTQTIARPSVACDICSVYAAAEAQGATGRGFYGGAAEQFTYFNTLQANGHTVANDGEYIDSSIAQVFVGYNFNHRLGVQFTLPVIDRAYGAARAGNHAEGGLGDVSLAGNFLVYENLTADFTVRWTALGGVKFPTGDAAHLNPKQPDFATGIGGHDLALGSGSYDGFVGTGLFTSWRRLFLTAGLQYAIRSDGAFGYQYANDLSWTGGPGVYLALEHGYTLAVQALVSGETKGQDTLAGVSTDDTAETIVYLGPQVNYTWSHKLSVQVGADLPVSIHSTGNQLVPDYRIHGAVTWRF